MTQTIDNSISMKAINKWVYYSLNYPVVEVEVADFKGTHTEYLPDFFNAFPIHIRKHFARKWNAYYEDYGSMAVMTNFYAELGNEYRRNIMTWVLANYNDEQAI